MRSSQPHWRATVVAGCITLAAFLGEIKDLRAASAARVPDPTVFREFATQLEAPPTTAIFAHNLIAWTILWSGGALAGILAVPQLIRIGHEVALGIAASKAVGASDLQSMSSLAPHGIFELAAFMLAAGSGFGTLVGVWRFAERKEGAQETLRKSAGLTAWSIGLLLLAALIECHLTPQILRLLA